MGSVKKTEEKLSCASLFGVQHVMLIPRAPRKRVVFLRKLLYLCTREKEVKEEVKVEVK